MDSATNLAALLGARRVGSCFVGNCPACGYHDALSIRMGHTAALVTCHAGCSREDIFRAIPGYAIRRMPGAVHLSSAENVRAPERATAAARALWQQAKPATLSPVRAYLSARGITVPIPPAIRFLYARHSPTGRVLPCMIAAVERWPSASLSAVHRTYLGDGPHKARIEPCRMTLGPIAGGAVRLSSAHEVVGVAEGIETSLSAMQLTGIPVWAALSAGGIEQLLLPPVPQARTVIVFADRDPRGIRAAETAAKRWRAEGRAVRIELPPEPGTDFNDMVNSQVRSVV